MRREMEGMRDTGRSDGSFGERLDLRTVRQKEETRDDGEGKLRGETSCSQWENSMGIRLSQWLHLSREGEFLPCIIIAQGPPLSSPAVPVASVSPSPCPRETAANNQYSMNAHYT